MAAITFLMGTDSGPNKFYTYAAAYFEQEHSEIVKPAGGGSQTLEGVFAKLRSLASSTPAKRFDTINIVSHASGFSSVEFKLRAAQADGISGIADLDAELTSALAGGAGAWKKLGPPIVTDKTTVRLHGCDVGRSQPFVFKFGLLFGDDLDVSAALRVAIFRKANATYQHRLARTWAIPWPNNIQTAKTPAQWATARSAWVSDASFKFGKALTDRTGDPLGQISMETRLKPIAAGATEVQAATYFFAETLTIILGARTVEQAKADMIGASSAVLDPPGTDIDDTTVKIAIGPAQMTDTSTAGALIGNVAVLAQVIDTPVSVTDTTQYRLVTITAGKIATPGPTPAGAAPAGAPPAGAPPAGAPPAAHSSLWDEGRDAAIAAGVVADDIDGLTAALEPAADDTFALADPELGPIEVGDGTALDAENFS